VTLIATASRDLTLRPRSTREKPPRPRPERTSKWVLWMMSAFPERFVEGEDRNGSERPLEPRRDAKDEWLDDRLTFEPFEGRTDPAAPPLPAVGDRRACGEGAGDPRPSRDRVLDVGACAPPSVSLRLGSPAVASELVVPSVLRRGERPPSPSRGVTVRLLRLLERRLSTPSADELLRESEAVGERVTVGTRGGRPALATSSPATIVPRDPVELLLAFSEVADVGDMRAGGGDGDNLRLAVEPSGSAVEALLASDWRYMGGTETLRWLNQSLRSSSVTSKVQ